MGERTETSGIQSVGYERSIGLGTGSQPSVQCKGVSGHCAGTQHVHDRARNRRGVEIFPEIQKNIVHTGGLTIGIVGQVIERKGHIGLLQAISLLVKKGLDIQLIIVGDGDSVFTAKVKMLIADLGLVPKITWRGFKKNLEEIYKGIDVLVAPTIPPEPFGLIVIEANMLGIPVIASNKGGFKETVTNGENGFLVEPEDAEQMAGRIEYFYTHRDAIETMGKKGHENVVQNFNQKIMIKKIDNLLTVL